MPSKEKGKKGNRQQHVLHTKLKFQVLIELSWQPHTSFCSAMVSPRFPHCLTTQPVMDTCHHPARDYLMNLLNERWFWSEYDCIEILLNFIGVSP